MNLQQLLLLVIALAIPSILFALGKKKWVLAWVCITMFVHIFDTQLVTNLAAGRLVGLLYLPVAIASYRSWLPLKPAKAYLVNFVYLLLLGILFGFIFPWVDTTGQRPFTLTAPGRVIVYFIRTLADLSLTIFIFHELKKPGRLLFIARMLIVGSVLTASFGAISLFKADLDFYNLITGLRYINLVVMARSRGLSFEPRGLGMACVYGILILLIYPSRLSVKKIFALATCTLGFVAAFSTSSLALLAGGIASSWYRLPQRARITVSIGIIVCTLFGSVSYNLFPTRLGTGIDNILVRVVPSKRLERLGGVSPKNFAETIAFQMDGFDASALLFLANHPIYAITGTGPTMVYLPASNYLLPGAYTAAYRDVGINSPPTLGLLLELANSGILGIVLWFVQVLSCYGALYTLSKRQKTPMWKMGRTFFLIGTIFYLIQVSQTSPIWNLILAIGWIAVYEQKKYKVDRKNLRKNREESLLVEEPLYAV